MLIENVVVAERCRGRGIGTGLMRALEDIAQENRCQDIMLVSGQARTAAHAFYHFLGYTEDKRFKKRWA